jgi:hypothetical protein
VLFASLAEQWRDWLTQSLGFEPANVHVLFGKSGKPDIAKEPATREAIEGRIGVIKRAAQPEDRLWVFLIGHGNYDGEHAYFHLSGRDLREDQWAKLFADIKCREQVFWLTSSASGWFLRSLSFNGRIVITATLADEEFNETEFPQVFTAVIKRPRSELDSNRDGKVSVLELYQQTVAEVNARFTADKRVPTEHAQLDDNGDGVGTEQPTENKAAERKTPADGALAATTYLPLK